VVGNDISQALITQTASATVDNGNELLTNGGTTYTYDANGNRLTETSASGTLTYTWDGRNRLSAIKNSNGNTTTLQYDFGRNLLGVSQTIGAATTTQSFVIDSLTNVVALTGPSGSAVSVLTGRSLDSHYASVDASGDVAFGIKDGLGSITGITDGSGNLAAKFDYEPFGQTTGTAESSYPFAYTGRVPILGNIFYYRNRFYDAGVGRFLSEDPIGLRGGSNLYAYVRNNPINRIDPRGFCGSSKPSGPDFSESCSLFGICAPGSTPPPQTLTPPPPEDTLSAGDPGYLLGPFPVNWDPAGNPQPPAIPLIFQSPPGITYDKWRASQPEEPRQEQEVKD
jgi:RHS repeat-associated protein